MDEQYDVVIYGVKEGQEPGEVAQAIANALSISLDTATKLIARDNGATLAKALTQKDADRIIKTLSRLGARANRRPSRTSGLTLELVAKTTKHDCPECGFSIELQEGETAPDTCPECGLVFSKYDQVKQRKQEEQRLRSKLQRVEEMRNQAELEEQARQAEAQRLKALEDRIRKELGIPAAVDKKWKLWTSAAVILVIGVGAGLGGARLFGNKEVTEQDRLLAEQMGEQGASLAAAPPPSAMLMAATAAVGMPQAMLSTAQQQSLDQLMTLSQQVTDQSSTPMALTAPQATDGLPAGVGIPGAPLSGLPGAVPASGTVGRTERGDERGDAALQSDPPPLGSSGETDLTWLKAMLVEDADWDRFIADQARQALDRGNVKQARQLAERIQAPAMRLSVLAQIASQLARAGDRTAAMVIDRLLDQAETLSSVSTRAELIAQLAATELSSPRARPGALRLIAKTEQWAMAIESPSEQATVWTRIGAAQAALGLTDDAHESIRRASATLQREIPVTAYVRITSGLAVAFERLNARDTALDLLAQGVEVAEGIDLPVPHDQAILAIAAAWAQIGALEQAVATSARVSTPSRRDDFLLELIGKQALAGHRIGLDGLAGLLQSPGHKAQAYALLGLLEDRPEGVRKHFAQAIASSKALPDGPRGDALRARVARMVMRAGFRQAGTQLFEQIEQGVARLESGAMREIGWAILAGSSARALEPKWAADYHARQQDEAVRALTQADLAQVNQTIELL